MAQDVTAGMDKWMQRKFAELKLLGDNYALRMEAHAKPNAPWKDRTSHARQGLFGEASEFFEGNRTLKVRISHKMDYGPYLELCNQGKYAILRPTRDKFQAPFYRDVQKVVNKK